MEKFKVEQGKSSPLSSKETSNRISPPGTLKTISTKGITGNEITSHFCPDCGTTLYRTGASFPGQIILKTGIIDDVEWPNEKLAQVEFFSGLRPKWIPAVEGATQLTTMVD